MCHFLAAAWVYIGQDLEDNQYQGWIYRMKKTQGTLEDTDLPYSTLYITSIYYIITTLSTVGYGDSVGTTNAEYIFQMLVMVGLIIDNA